MNAHQIVEAVLFASDAPLTADEIARADESLDEDQVEQAIQLLQAEYDDAHRSFEINELAEGYQILTRPEFAPYLERFDTVPRPSRLSGPALETLAIIAYRQPLGRIEIEYIRGVGSSGVIKTLTDRQLVEVVGRAEGLGRPLLYGTTTFFLEHFGFKSLEDLPRPEELPVVLRDRVPLDMDDDDDEVEPEPQEELALPSGTGEGDGEDEGDEGEGEDGGVPAADTVDEAVAAETGGGEPGDGEEAEAGPDASGEEPAEEAAPGDGAAEAPEDAGFRNDGEEDGVADARPAETADASGGEADEEPSRG